MWRCAARSRRGRCGLPGRVRARGTARAPARMDGSGPFEAWNRCRGHGRERRPAPAARAGGRGIDRRGLPLRGAAHAVDLFGHATPAVIGVFGGSGFYEFLDDVEEVRIDTPYGAPSAATRVGDIEGKKVAFMPRQGDTHQSPPHQVNFRANVW